LAELRMLEALRWRRWRWLLRALELRLRHADRDVATGLRDRGSLRGGGARATLGPRRRRVGPPEDGTCPQGEGVRWTVLVEELAELRDVDPTEFVLENLPADHNEDRASSRRLIGGPAARQRPHLLLGRRGHVGIREVDDLRGRGEKVPLSKA